MSNKKLFYRMSIDRFFLGMIFLFSFLSMFPLFFIIYYIIKNGISVINWGFLINLPKPVGELGGGVSNAIVGTMMLISLATVLAVPLAIAIGIYLAENRDSRLAYFVRLCVDILQGIPSIVIGIIAWLWIVVPMGGFSAFSGSMALAIMMLPIIVRSTEETLKLIPNSIKEASLALGVPYYRTMLKVVLPTGISGIFTGVLLSVSRIAGESAPLLFTAFGNPFMNYNILKPVNSLPLMIFNYATSPYEDWIKAAWGASFVLLFFVLALNILTKVVTNKWKIRF